MTVWALRTVTVANIDHLTRRTIDDRRIYSSKALRIFIINQEVPRTTKEGRRLRRLARLAANYERAKEKALVDSNYDDAARRCADRVDAIFEIAQAIQAAPPPLTPA